MKTNWAFFAGILVLAVAHGQNNSNKCAYTCKLSKKNQNENTNFIIGQDNGISYYYIKDQKSFIVFNENKRLVMVLNGDWNTLTIMNSDNDVSVIINLNTYWTYVIPGGSTKFDMSKISKDNYHVIFEINNYILQYIPNVTNDNNQNLINLIDFLRDIETSTVSKNWNSFMNNPDQLRNFKTFKDLIETLHILLQKQEYFVEMGPSLFAIYITEYYKTEDALLKYIAEFLVFQIQSLKGNYMDMIMPRFYKLIISDNNMSIIFHKFKILNWAIIGLNFTYLNIEDAMQAYDNNNVVITNVTTIANKHNNSYVALFAGILVLVIVIARGQNYSDKCAYTCKKNQNENRNFIIGQDNGVSYYYKKDQKSFIVYNKNKRLVIVLNGDSNTLTIMDPDNGVSIIINLNTYQTYVIPDGSKKFDISEISKGNYRVIFEINNYILQYVPNVTTNNNRNLINLIDILRDVETSTDSKNWNSFKDNPNQLRNFKTFKDLTETLHILFQKQEYNAEMGPSLLAIYITEYYKTEDALLKYIAEFLVFQVQSLKGDYMNMIMPRFYKLIISGYSMSTIIQKFKILNWAIIGLNFTYLDIEDAMQAYDNNNVVQTNVTTITNKHNNSYVAYSSMRNGIWRLRVTYANSQFVQITGTTKHKHIVIWDPSIDLAMVFPEGEKFGMFNWKSGNGLVFNGKTNQAIFVSFKDSQMVDAFKSGNIPHAFYLMGEIVLDTEIDEIDKAFQGDKLLVTIRDGGDFSTIISDQQTLELFKNDFSYLIKNMNNFKYTEEYGVVNLVSIMLITTQSDFFQEGFVEMMHQMYVKNISLTDFHVIMYAGILRSEQENWQHSIFQNICDLLKLVQNNADPMSIIAFIQQYIKLQWGKMDVTSAQFLERGILVNK